MFRRCRRAFAVLALSLAAGWILWWLRFNPFIASFTALAAAVLISALIVGAGKSRLSTALWAVVSVLVILAALDAEVGALFKPTITVAGGGPFVVSDPLLGYRPTPAGRARVRWRRLGHVIYDARYSIDSQGFRLTRGAPAGQAPSTVFLGDSYTFGDGLDDRDALPEQYAAAKGYRRSVINAAFSGYGTGQVLRLIQSDRLAPVLGSGPRTFVYCAIEQHLKRIDGRSPLQRVGTPRYELAGGAARFVGPFHPGLGGLVLGLASHSAIVAGLRDLNLAAPSAQSPALFGAMVQAAKAEARRRYHAGFIVVLWDEPVWQDGADPRRARRRAAMAEAMAAELARRGVAFLRVSALIPDYPVHMRAYVIAGSGHPSALLNRRLALELARRL